MNIKIKKTSIRFNKKFIYKLINPLSSFVIIRTESSIKTSTKSIQTSDGCTFFYKQVFIKSLRSSFGLRTNVRQRRLPYGRSQQGLRAYVNLSFFKNSAKNKSQIDFVNKRPTLKTIARKVFFQLNGKKLARDFSSIEKTKKSEKSYTNLFSQKLSQINKMEKEKKIVPIEYSLDTFHRSNQDTCLVHKPVVFEGDWVETGDLLADCSASIGGELSLGHNILIAYMPWEGFNYEDAILISERLVYDDVYTSVHIERYETEIRDTKNGKEKITKEIPDVFEKEIKHLNNLGVCKIGTLIEEGAILVGKITPISQKNHTPYQKLLYTLLEKKFVPYKDNSLRAPKGIKAKVINVYFFKKSTEKKENQLKNKATYSKKKNKIEKNFIFTKSVRSSNECNYLIKTSKNNEIFLDKKKIINAYDIMMLASEKTRFFLKTKTCYMLKDDTLQMKTNFLLNFINKKQSGYINIYKRVKTIFTSFG